MNRRRTALLCLALTFLAAVITIIIVQHGTDRPAVRPIRNAEAKVSHKEALDLPETKELRQLHNRYRPLNMKRLKPNQVYRFKIYSLMQDGIPLIAVRVLSQANLFVCVADTGSMELNLSGSACARCDKGYGHYEHTKQLDQAEGQLLIYGTQKDLVKEVVDQVQLHHDGDVYSVPICVTVERSLAQSNYNVCGLQNTRGRNERGFLDEVLRQNENLLVRFERPMGTVAGLKEEAVKRFESRALVRVPLVQSRGMGFYMTRVEGIRVGNKRVETGAKLIIWDTGSNLTSVPPTTFKQLRSKLRHGGPITFELDKGQTFTVEPANYYWHGTREIMVDDDLDVLGPNSDGYIIMGAYCMQGHQFLFAKDHLSIAPSHLGPIEV